jgi:menaquinone-dependent protoporphyrinogen oxidase
MMRYKEAAMSGSVLVAYATRYGSTKEVAEAVAATLREHQLDASVRNTRDVVSLDGYGAVVLGAPLYISSLHKDATKFLSRHQEALTKLPVAVFALGPTRGGEEERKGARAQLDGVLAKLPWLTPVALEMFGGKYDPTTLNFLHKLMAALPASPLHGLPASDARDWGAIRAWAVDVAVKLVPA